MPDFAQDYAAAWGVLHGYSPNERTAVLMAACCSRIQANDIVMQTAHPPSATLLAIPFAWLPWDIARWAWLFLGWLIIAASWASLALTPINCLMTAPIWALALAIGTFEPIIFGLLTVAIVRAKRPSITGLAIGSAVVLKLYPILVMIPLLIGRRWRTAFYAGITIVALALLAEGVTHGTYGWLQYLPANTSRWVDVSYNYSLVRLIREIVPGTAPFVGALLICLFFTAPLAQRLKQGDIQVMVPVILLANPLVWVHYLGLLATRSIGYIERACFFFTGMLLWAIGLNLVPVDGLAPVAFAPMAVSILLIWFKDTRRDSP